MVTPKPSVSGLASPIEAGPTWEIIDEFNILTGAKDYAAVATNGGAPVVTRISNPRTIPSGAVVKVQSVSIQVIAGPPDQLLWSLIVLQAIAPWVEINASAMQQLGLTPINRVFEPPGPLAIDIKNISNSNYSGGNGTAAGQAYTVTAQITILAQLLGLRNRRGLLHGQVS